MHRDLAAQSETLRRLDSRFSTGGEKEACGVHVALLSVPHTPLSEILTDGYRERGTGGTPPGEKGEERKGGSRMVG